MKTQTHKILLGIVYVISWVSVSEATLNPPIAVVTPTSQSATVGQTVFFADGGSYDPDSGQTIVAFAWTFPSSAVMINSRDSNTTFCKFNTEGQFTVNLKVQDNTGQWSTTGANCTVTVTGTSNTWYVSPSGNDVANNGQDIDHSFHRIQTAIDIASNGNSVVIAQGTYLENINFYGKNISVRSENPEDAQVVANTIIDGAEVGTVVHFNGTENSTCEIKGVTVTGGGVSDGLLGYWNFNESTGNVEDQTPFNRDGIIEGGASRTNAGTYFGNVLEFDGVDDYVHFPKIRGVTGCRPRTCALWLKTTTSNYEKELLYWGEDDFGKRWRIHLIPSDDQTFVRVDVLGGCKYSVKNVGDGAWHHMAITWEDDGSPDIADAKIYIDGVLDTSAISSSHEMNTGNTDDIYQGKFIGHNFVGQMDELRIYGRALSSSEILQLANKPEAHWKLDDGSGTTAVDSSGNGHDGNLLGNMTSGDWVTGLFGQALDFDGIDDCVDTDNVIDPSLQSFSAFAWIYVNSLPSGDSYVILTQKDGSGTGRVWLRRYGTTNKLGCYLGGVDTVSNSAILAQIGKWHHVGVTCEILDTAPVTYAVRLYINGVQDGSGTVTVESSIGGMRIGAHKGNNAYWPGKIDDVRIYNSALTAEEIRILSRLPGPDAHWKLDETTGGTASDSGPLGYPGSLQGMESADWVKGVVGNALEFDGVDEYVTVTGYKGISGANQRTCAAWIKTTATVKPILYWGTNATGGLWDMRVSNYGRLRVIAGGGPTVDSATTINTGQWVHVAAVLPEGGNNTDDVLLYVNGVLETNISVTVGTINTGDTVDVRIGADEASHHFTGQMDDVRIYRRALSASEIRELASGGGGISGYGTHAQVSRCTIGNNHSETDGGGIYDVDGLISQCRIETNTSGAEGGGLARCDGTIANCLIIGNDAVDGDGLDECNGTIVNCTIADNTTAGIGLKDCSGTITNSIISGQGTSLSGCGSAAITYCDIQGGASGTGNLNVVPVFVGSSDYHLQTVSRCIDAGDRSSEYSLEPLPNGGRINMGAYGNTPEAEIAADSDQDGMPDWWESMHNLDPEDSDDADLDDDDGDQQYGEAGHDDGLTNYWEYLCGTNPFDLDSDDNSTSDADEDFDGDGFSNKVECENGMNPLVSNVGESITFYEYDTAGRVSMQRTIAVANNTIHMTENRTEYDDLGRQKLQRRLANPGVASGSGPSDTMDSITLYGYDVLNNQVKIVQKGYNGAQANSNMSQQVGDLVTENDYDDLGRTKLTKVWIKQVGGVDKFHITQYTYKEATGQLETVEIQDEVFGGNFNPITTNYYDPAGRVTKVKDGNGHYRLMDYDSFGRVIREVAMDCNGTKEDNQTADDDPLMQKRTEYDGMGHVITQAVMAAADSTEAINRYVDQVTDFTYATDEGDYPGMLVSTTRYYGYVSGDSTPTIVTQYLYNGMGQIQETKVIDSVQTASVVREYDSMGRVTQQVQTDINPVSGGSNVVQTTLYEYNDLGMLEKLRQAKGEIDPANLDLIPPLTDSDWLITTYDYALGRQIQETKPNGVITTFLYDTFGNKTQMIADSGGLNQKTEWGFNRLGRQVTISGWTDDTDNDTQQTTTYVFDGLGRVTQITYPDSETIQYTYNAGNKVETRTDQRNIVTTYDYDNNYNMTSKSVIMDVDPQEDDVDDTVEETFTYDGLNQKRFANKSVFYDSSSTETKISEIEFTYYGLGTIHEFKQKLFGELTARTIDYDYDQAGFVKSTIYPDTTFVTRTNTGEGQIASLAQGGATLASYQYVGSRPARRVYPGPSVTTDSAYDNLGRITAVDAGTTLAKFRYSYLANEHNIDRQYLDHRSVSTYNQFSYDNLDRLTGVTYHDTKVDAFAMDDLGNRIGNQTQRDILHNYYMDPLTNDPKTNRYSTIDAAPITHDQAGNMTQDRQGYVYSYDYENRIVRIENGVGNFVASFDYDALGHRIRKIAGTETTLHYNDPEWRVLAEYDAANNQLRKYVYGNYIDEALVLIDTYASDNSPVGTYYFLHDHLYSPALLIGYDDENEIWIPVERYEFDAYGTARIMDPSFGTRGATQYGVTTLFTGRTLDSLDSAALKIMYYRARSFDPTAGRFLQQDPIGYRDAMSLYGYARNRPVCSLDNMGLFSIEAVGTPVACLANKKCIDRLWMSIALKPTADEVSKLSNGGYGVMRKYANWKIRDCSNNMPIKSPPKPEMATFFRELSAGGKSPGPSGSGWVEIIRMKGLDPEPEGQPDIYVPNENGLGTFMSPFYSAMISKFWTNPSSGCCSSGEVTVFSGFYLYAGLDALKQEWYESIPIPGGAWDDNDNTISTPEYGKNMRISQGWDHIKSIRQPFATGYINVHIEWDCNQKIRVSAIHDVPFSLGGGMNNRTGDKDIEDFNNNQFGIKTGDRIPLPF